MMSTRALVAAAALSTLPVAPVIAQPMDVAAMQRWSKATVVRYHIVGAYEGQTVIAHKEPGGQATVTDRVEMDLDWDMRQNRIIGKPRIVNAKSVAKDLRNEGPSCPPPSPPRGDYEHMEATEVVSSQGQRVEMKGVRSFPEIDVTASCSGSWYKRTVKAAKEPVLEYVAIPAPMMLGMPPGASGKFAVSQDRKSFSLQAGSWLWTYTPSVGQ